MKLLYVRRKLLPAEIRPFKRGSTLKVMVQSCNGIEKVYGLVAREVARILAEKLRPDKVTSICLPRLMNGDDEAKMMIEENPCIVIDGCANRCARNIVEQAGGKLVVSVSVVDVLKENRHLMPRGQSLRVLDEKGLRLAEKIAERLVIDVDNILEE